MKWLIAGLMILTCLMMATWSMAGDPRIKLIQVAGNHEKNVGRAQDNLEIQEQIPEPKSMLAEIRAVMDSTRGAEQALKVEFSTDQGLELTRRLGELKKASRMRILHIQLKHARGEGRAELEHRILTSIEDLQRPAAPGGPRLSGRISPSPVTETAETPADGSQR
jgi:hypothetical protein